MACSAAAAARRGHVPDMPVLFGAVAAGDRDVELRIAPHAVLGDVQAGRLDLRLGADPDRDLEQQQHEERRAERERADRREAERLRAELVQAAAVEEAALAGRELVARLGMVRNPSDSVPQTPAMPCAAMAPIGIVDADLLDEEHSEDDDHAGDEADQIAAQGATNAHDAVIATRAAMAPLSIIERSGFLITIHAVTTAPSTPAAAAMFVFMAT